MCPLVASKNGPDPGADFFRKREPEQTKTRAIRQLKTLRYDVSLTPAGA
jgi:hypothetical protein